MLIWDYLPVGYGRFRLKGIPEFFCLTDLTCTPRSTLVIPPLGPLAASAASVVVAGEDVCCCFTRMFLLGRHLPYAGHLTRDGVCVALLQIYRVAEG